MANGYVVATGCRRAAGAHQDRTVPSFQPGCPDARLLASASEDGTTRLTNLAFGSRLLNVPLEAGSKSYDVDFSSDGRWLAVACKEGVWVWSLPQGLDDLGDIRLRTWATLVARPGTEADEATVTWGE